MVLVRGSGVVVLDLLFPQLLASNSIVSRRFALLVLVWGRTGERNLKIVKPGWKPGQPDP